MIKAVFELQPLTHPSCINHIEDTLNTTKGIYSASVSFSSKRVLTQYDEKQIEMGDIEALIEELGYPVILHNNEKGYSI